MDISADQPIADFFPHCTGTFSMVGPRINSPGFSLTLYAVFFGDIAGFTAWSSTREPAQVFLLLQTLYQNFDLIAKRRRVFKVETIGEWPNSSPTLS